MSTFGSLLGVDTALITGGWGDDPKGERGIYDLMPDEALIASAAHLTDYDMALLWKAAEKAGSPKHFKRYWRVAHARKQVMKR